MIWVNLPLPGLLGIVFLAVVGGWYLFDEWRKHRRK